MRLISSLQILNLNGQSVLHSRQRQANLGEVLKCLFPQHRLPEGAVFPFIQAGEAAVQSSDLTVGDCWEDIQDFTTR